MIGQSQLNLTSILRSSKTHHLGFSEISGD